jgi:manganese/iron transport system permease protein
MNWWEPLEYAFLRDAMMIGSLIAVMCAVLSCFLVLRGWSLMGDAVSHSLLPGIVLAYLVGAPLLIGAFLAGLLCAVGTGWVKNMSRLKEDTAMGVVFTGLFAFGLVLFSKVPSDLHLDHILFGNLLGIGAAEIREVMWVAIPVLAVLLLKRRDFLLLCFDPSQARVTALPVGLLHYGLLSLLSLAIVVSLKAVGIILVTAMLITPGATAFLWTSRFDRMILISACTAVVSTILGVMISYHADASPAACIVLFQAALFAISRVIAAQVRMNHELRNKTPNATHQNDQRAPM